jgi:glycosyltransferase involved in cell wall biosynthesis
MIPLRVLHALVAVRGAEWEAFRALAAACACVGHEAALLLPAGVETAFFPVVSLPSSGWRWLLGGRQRTTRAVAAWMPDLIHVHHPELLGPAMEVGRRLALPVTAVMNGHYDTALLRRLRDPRLTCTVVPAEHHRAQLISGLGLLRDRVTVIPCGLTPQGPSRALVSSGAFTLGACGPHLRGRHLDRLLTAVVRRSVAGTALRVRLLPDPATPEADREDLAQLAQRHGDAVEIAVAAAGTPLGEFLDSCDVFAELAPDPHPWPLLVALAHGRPVLGSAAGPVAEWLPADEVALLIDPADPTALDQALERYADPSLRRVFGAAGRRLVRDRFDAAVVARATADLWRTAIGEADPTSGDITSVWRRATASRLPPATGTAAVQRSMDGS